MGDFPKGATKGVGTSTLNWLKGMPFQDVEELVEWLLDTPGEDPIRPRTASERSAYESGMVTGIELCATKGVKFAVDELKMMVETREAFRRRNAAK